MKIEKRTISPMACRHSDVSNEEGSRTVGVEGGLNALTRQKRDVKLQGDHSPSRLLEISLSVSYLRVNERRTPLSTIVVVLTRR